MSSTINATTTSGIQVTGDNSGSLALQTNNGTTAVTVDTAQNVGIGTSSPAYKLDVTGASTRVTNGTRFMFNNIDVNGSGIWDTAGASGQGVYLNTASSYVATYTGSTERMRIDSSGNLLINTTDAGMTTGNGIKLTPAGDGSTYPRVGIVTAATTNPQSVNYSLYSTGAAAYRFYVGAGGTISATSTTITAISDQRLKENIRDLDDGLDKVMALKPRKFDWKQGKGKDKKDDRGWIAQEFEQVFPDMIDQWLDPAPEGEEPYKAVNADLIPTLVKSIQELKQIVDAQAAEIAALKTKVGG